MKRELLATFFCDEDGKLWLHALSVSEPKTGYNGKEYWSLDHYDVDWCKRDNCYLFHCSGGGGAFPQVVEGIYWRTAGFRVRERAAKWCNGDGDGIDHAATKYIRMRNRTRRLIKLPKDLRGAKHYDYSVSPCRVSEGDLLDWLEHNARQEDSVFCGECADDLPGDDLCGHCWWCETVGWYVTPSSETTVCFDANCWGCRSHRRAEHEAYWDKKRQERWAASREVPA